jgi:hypothetical protein
MLSVQARRGPQANSCDTFRPRPPAGGVAAGLRPGKTALCALRRWRHRARAPSATALHCFQDCGGGSLNFEADGKTLIRVAA